jgi:hypothetical protein
MRLMLTTATTATTALAVAFAMSSRAHAFAVNAHYAMWFKNPQAVKHSDYRSTRYLTQVLM